MPLQDMNSYKLLLDQHTAEQSRKDAIEAQKAENEKRKIDIELSKVTAQFQKDDVEKKALATDILGKELENKEKKAGLLASLYEGSNTETLVNIGKGLAGLVSPSGSGERKGATKTAQDVKSGLRKQTDIDAINKQLAESSPPPAPAPAPAPAQEPLATPFEPPPVPSIQQSRLSVPAPPFPETRPTMEALDAQKREIKAGIETRAHIQKQQEAITSAFTEAGNQYRRQLIRNNELQRQLAQDPPTYRKAISNIGLIPAIIGIVDAGMHGHLYENPTQLLDGLIERELSDQISRYRAGESYLQSQQYMYSQFYALNKDHFEAESSTKAMLYKGVQDQIDAYSKLAVTEQQRAQLGNLSKEIRYKHQMEVAKMQQAGEQNAFENAIKIAGLKIKQQEADIKQMKVTGAGGSGLSPKERIDRRVPFGGEDFYDIPKGALDKKEGVRDTIRASKKSVRGSYGLEKVASEITKGSGVKSFFAGLPFTDIGEKERARFETLNKGLIKLMLKSRIEFTGGGNMSEQEQRFLRQFYEVKEGKFILKNTQKVLKILMGLGRGDYETLFKIVRKDAFFNALTEMQQSPSFTQLNTEAQQYALTKKELGVSDKDLTDYLKGVEYK